MILLPGVIPVKVHAICDMPNLTLIKTDSQQNPRYPFSDLRNAPHLHCKTEESIIQCLKCVGSAAIPKLQQVTLHTAILCTAIFYYYSPRENLYFVGAS